MRLCIMLLIPILWGMAWDAIFNNWKDLKRRRDIDSPIFYDRVASFSTIEEAQKFIDDYLLGIKNKKAAVFAAKVKSTKYEKYP